MKQISIIIPIYNSESYLHRCLESAVRQTYQNIELLLIDDGSTDSSYKICMEYARKDSRIKCIHTENTGRVRARKTGMENASGELIAFLDSDDWLEEDAMEMLLNEMERQEVDIVATGYIESSVGVKEKVVLNAILPGVYKGKTFQTKIISAMLCKNDFFEAGIQPYLWNKLFKREIIEKYIMKADDRFVIGEDVVCLYPAIMHADSISIMEQAYYHYCIHADSTMMTYREEEKEIENIRLQYQVLKAYFKSNTNAGILIAQTQKYILHHYMVRCFSYIARFGSSNAFPFGDIPEKSRIIVYGAGAFGKATYQFFTCNTEYKVTGWYDGNYEKYDCLGYPVENPELLSKTEYDVIILAVMSERIAEEIRNGLISQNIEKEKIKWLDVSYLLQDGFFQRVVEKY